MRGSNVIKVYVKRLRQKCGKSLIRTRRGQGYIFEAARRGPSFSHQTDGGHIGKPG
jgi:hypothetical protein